MLQNSAELFVLTEEFKELRSYFIGSARFSESLRYMVSLIIPVSLLIVLSCFITMLSGVGLSVVSLLQANKTVTRRMKHNFFIVQIFV